MRPVPVSGPRKPICPDVQAATLLALIVGLVLRCTAEADAAETPATMSANTSAFFIYMSSLLSTPSSNAFEAGSPDG